MLLKLLLLLFICILNHAGFSYHIISQLIGQYENSEKRPTTTSQSPKFNLICDIFKCINNKKHQNLFF